MHRSKFASFFTRAAPFAFAAFIALAPAAHARELLAKTDFRAPTSPAVTWAPAESYAEGLLLRSSGDAKGAFQAFLKAVAGGHALAQRRLGEIYDNGNGVAGRDLLESIRWYQKAREQGELIAQPPRRSFGMTGPAI